MTNREMVDKYKDLINERLDKLKELYKTTGADSNILVKMGEALEKYMWMDIQLEEDRQDKDKETE